MSALWRIALKGKATGHRSRRIFQTLREIYSIEITNLFAERQSVPHVRNQDGALDLQGTIRNHSWVSKEFTSILLSTTIVGRRL